MAQYQIKASGVRRDTQRHERLNRTLHATDDATAMETVANDYAPSIREEYFSIPNLELSRSEGDETTIGIYDMAAKKWLVGDIPLDERPIFSGFNRNQLSEAFDKVRDPNNWKHPIDKVMPADLDQDLTSAAIAFFAGSETTFEPAPEGIRVRAAGYYVDIGA